MLNYICGLKYIFIEHCTKDTERRLYILTLPRISTKAIFVLGNCYATKISFPLN